MKEQSITDILIKKTEECESLRSTLRLILMNTLNRDFKGDAVYKHGVLSNIKNTLGEEEYNTIIKLYS